MSNPNAVSIFNGRLTADPKFFTNKDGVEFAASFNVAVQRARPDKDGEFQSDYYPCRYSGARRLEVKKLEDGREFVPKIRRIKKSDVVSIIGCFRSEKYEKDGETKYVQYFDVERIGTPTGVYPKKDHDQTPQNQSPNQPQQTAQSQTPQNQQAHQEPQQDPVFPDFDMDLDDDDFGGLDFE